VETNTETQKNCVKGEKITRAIITGTYDQLIASLADSRSKKMQQKK